MSSERRASDAAKRHRFMVVPAIYVERCDDQIRRVRFSYFNAKLIIYWRGSRDEPWLRRVYLGWRQGLR